MVRSLLNSMKQFSSLNSCYFVLVSDKTWFESLFTECAFLVG